MSFSAGALPEADLLAEASVLGGCLRYGTDAYLDVADVVRLESFCLAENQAAWRCVQHVLGGAERVGQLDLPSFYGAASSLGLGEFLQTPDIRRHVQTLFNVPVELESVRRLALRVRKLDVARELRRRHEQAMAELAGVTGDESIDDILRVSDRATSSLVEELSGAVRQGRARQIADGARERYRELVKAPRQQVGFPSGFGRFDSVNGGGFRPGSLVLVIARQGVGKSSLANNIALNVAGRLSLPVLFLDSEMEIEQQQDRAAAALAQLFVRKVERGDLTRAEQVALGESLKKLEGMPYYHKEVKGLQFEDIVSRIRRWISREVGYRDDGKCNPCLVIYDYFQINSLKDVSRQWAEWQTLGLHAKVLKELMGNSGAACLAFGQMNREGNDQPDARSIRVDRLLDSVTAFWTFHEKPPEEVPPAKPGEPRLTHELQCFKSRFGAKLTSGNYINVATDYARGLMAEGPTKDELFELQGGRLKGVAHGRVAESAEVPTESAPDLA